MTNATDAIVALSEALLTLTHHDKRPPCAHDDRWTSDDAGQRATAVVMCGSCPLIVPCRQYADQIKATHGVWAGVDRTKTTRREATS